VTPAVRAAKAAGIRFAVHAFDPTGEEGYGAQAARALGVPPERVFKTLVARIDGTRLVVAIVPVSSQLDPKRLAAADGGKRAGLAPAREAERATGYVLGGISPLGQRRRLPTFLDVSALGHETILVSGGRRGLELELPPAALLEACAATPAAIAR
jgi:Cys-tRNA(Pro)/Cys-tRNA(Cys) deacylase